jgi:DnaJ-domain-containing protein 1
MYRSSTALYKMNQKFRTTYEDLEAEEERLWRRKAKAEQDAAKKAAKRQLKQERQKERAKAETYYKKGDKYEPPPPPSVSDFRIEALRRLGLTAAQDNPIAIRSAYRKMALRYHPDKNHAPDAAEQFKAIHAAYMSLC